MTDLAAGPVWAKLYTKLLFLRFRGQSSESPGQGAVRRFSATALNSGFGSKKRKPDARSAKKNPGQVCAFCVSSFALFVFPGRVIH
jgi:hypothetical protein